MSKSKNTSLPIFNATYKSIPIKSDSRVHLAVMNFFLKKHPEISETTTFLDVATGRGALAQRLIDNFEGITIDCNDLDDQVMVTGAGKIFSKDLNKNFRFERKYDVILAVEIIEHLENPFHFIRTLKNNLNSDGFILLTTPNVDSFFDRLWFLFTGYSFYFGSRGIVNSGGHITMCPEWLLRYISEQEGMEFELIKTPINLSALLGWKGKLLLWLLSPLKLLIKDPHDRGFTICVFKNKGETIGDIK